MLQVCLSCDDNFIDGLCKGWITDTHKQQNIWFSQDSNTCFLHKALQWLVLHSSYSWWMIHKPSQIVAKYCNVPYDFIKTLLIWWFKKTETDHKGEPNPVVGESCGPRYVLLSKVIVWTFKDFRIELCDLDLFLNLWPLLTLSTTSPKFRSQVSGLCHLCGRDTAQASSWAGSSEEGKGKWWRKEMFSRSYRLKRGECYFDMDILIFVCSLKVHTDSFFLVRGYFCACSCGMSRMHHLDGKWVCQSAKLSSPERSLTDTSHLLVGCSVPLCLQSGSFKLLIWRERLRNSRPATFLWWQCLFLTEGIVPAVATRKMSGHWCTWLLWRSAWLLLRLPLLKEFLFIGGKEYPLYRRTPGSHKNVTVLLPASWYGTECWPLVQGLLPNGK